MRECLPIVYASVIVPRVATMYAMPCHIFSVKLSPIAALVNVIPVAAAPFTFPVSTVMTCAKAVVLVNVIVFPSSVPATGVASVEAPSADPFVMKMSTSSIAIAPSVSFATPRSLLAIVALVAGNVIVVLSVPASVTELFTVNVFPSAIVSVDPAAGAVSATLLIDVAVAAPSTGATRVLFDIVCAFVLNVNSSTTEAKSGIVSVVAPTVCDVRATFTNWPFVKSSGVAALVARLVADAAPRFVRSSPDALACCVVLALVATTSALGMMYALTAPDEHTVFALVYGAGGTATITPAALTFVTV